MELQKAESLAKDLKELACISCTKSWLEGNGDIKEPIQMIKTCGELGLIPSELKERLINEVQEIIKDRDKSLRR
tara:strand:+ start:276 stop:497 length:222 start_codon:yes stop_codon:yes gene_type:complete